MLIRGCNKLKEKRIVPGLIGIYWTVLFSDHVSITAKNYLCLYFARFLAFAQVCNLAWCFGITFTKIDHCGECIFRAQS